jgi:hypothetical protein
VLANAAIAGLNFPGQRIRLPTIRDTYPGSTSISASPAAQCVSMDAQDINL